MQPHGSKEGRRGGGKGSSSLQLGSEVGIGANGTALGVGVRVAAAGFSLGRHPIKSLVLAPCPSQALHVSCHY